MKKYVRTGVCKGKAGEKRIYHPAYKAWQNMMTRCYNPKANNFHRYGGRGIEVCVRWHESFKFLEDMLPTWFEGGSLDRINNDGNYAPKNCAWIPLSENKAKNSRIIEVEVNGKRMSASAAYAILKPPYSYATYRRRLISGQPI